MVLHLLPSYELQIWVVNEVGFGMCLEFKRVLGEFHLSLIGSMICLNFKPSWTCTWCISESQIWWLK